MTPYLIIAIYFLAALGTGWLGRNTVAGGPLTFVLAIVFTPLVVFTCLLAFTRRG
ncbi:MAG: hypothetical protein AAFR84_11035 [Pseudomonadota bacterium]